MYLNVVTIEYFANFIYFSNPTTASVSAALGKPRARVSLALWRSNAPAQGTGFLVRCRPRPRARSPE